MAKQLISEIKPYVNLYRDDATGIAWVEDGSLGMRISVHANIDKSGSVKGMKKLGYWNEKDRTVKCGGYIYNIDSFVCDREDEKEIIVARHCDCQGCIDRRNRKTDKYVQLALERVKKEFPNEDLSQNYKDGIYYSILGKVSREESDKEIMDYISNATILKP